MNTEGVPFAALSLVLLAVVAEVIWSRRRGVELYSRNETLASVAVGVMNRLGGLVTLAVKYAAIAFVARFVPWELPDTVWTFLAGFVVVEVFYYWYHRMNHEVPFLWALHHVHHSSPEYNMTTSIRLNVLSNLVGAVWFAPMALFGFSDTVILTTLSAAGTLAVLDRIFGTYQPEIGPVTYGATTGHYGYNPIKLVFQPILSWATRKGWKREKAIIEQQAA